jgi:hypothetical protein
MKMAAVFPYRVAVVNRAEFFRRPQLLRGSSHHEANPTLFPLRFVNAPCGWRWSTRAITTRNTV